MESLSGLYSGLIVMLLGVIAFFMREQHETLKSYGKDINKLVERVVRLEERGNAVSEANASRINDHEDRLRRLETSDK
jgi:gamma-glutamyltranspeptidase